MPRRAPELTDLAVRRMKHPNPEKSHKVTFAVGGVAGLLLQVSPTNAKSWLLRSTIAGKRREIGLGPYPEIGLSTARDRAREARELIRQGIDPLERQKAERAAHAAENMRGLTFVDAMEKFLEGKLAEFDNEKHRKQWRATLDKYAVPALGDMLVSDIRVADILRTLEPIWKTKTETASRLRGRIEAVLAWATVAGHREGDNPARWKGNLDTQLPKPSKVAKVVHHAALALDDAAPWFKDVQQREGFATRAVEFMTLTAARSGEVRGMVWSEVDLDAAIWTIPGDRMKAGAEHRVPLTDTAVSLLRALPRMAGSEVVFPSTRGGALSDAALSACMRRVNEARANALGSKGYVDRQSGRTVVPHGLRSTFRDWAAERTEYPREMAEIALAHTVGSEVERAYRRSDMLEKRRQMMAAWARFLRGEAIPTVVSLKSAASVQN